MSLQGCSIGASGSQLELTAAEKDDETVLVMCNLEEAKKEAESKARQEKSRQEELRDLLQGHRTY